MAGVGFSTRAEAERAVRTLRRVEHGEFTNVPHGTPLGVTVRPGDLYSDTKYRLGVLTWYDANTDAYEDDTTQVLIRTHNNPSPPPENIPVYAIFAGIKIVSTSVQYAVYLVGPGSSALIHVTSSTADSGGWPATLYVNNGDGTFSTGPNIRVGLSPNGGDTFNVGDYVGAVLNGTVTVSGTTYPKYWHPGCDQNNVNDCVDDVPGYRVWSLPHPWTVGSFIPD